MKIIWGNSSVGRASALRAECRRFKSGLLHKGVVAQFGQSAALSRLRSRVQAPSASYRCE